MANTSTSQLLALPAELREIIWDYTLSGTIVQVPSRSEHAYAFCETQLRRIDSRVDKWHNEELQAIKEEGHPAILRTSKEIRHEALPRYYMFSVFRFDDEETLVEWLSARPTRVRQSLINVEFMLRQSGGSSDFNARREQRNIALGEGVLKVKTNELWTFRF
ncbi:hypothetical protein LTR22_021490 [Elasticomyces elasticus]|nr:hypothetical protein LTR22_021490 [Elasticomyces elasticus]KAK4930987.1 hypothetical protein LTR49_002402 [Elasticomyces elasticus]KAK5742548.1 hypothetical protein LTS12_024221 [Elasticomyces elasticus]